MDESEIPCGKLQLAAVRVHHIRRERAEVERKTGEGNQTSPDVCRFPVLGNHYGMIRIVPN